MALPLTLKKREQLFQAWLKKKSIAQVSRKLRVSEPTIRKYRRLDRWDERLLKIEQDAQKKTDTKAKQEFENNLTVAEHVKKSYLVQLIGRTSTKCPKCGAVVYVTVPKIKAAFRDIMPILQYIDELRKDKQAEDRPKLIKSPFDISKISQK